MFVCSLCSDDELVSGMVGVIDVPPRRRRNVVSTTCRTDGWQIDTAKDRKLVLQLKVVAFDDRGGG